MQLKAQGVEAHKEREFEDATGYFKQVIEPCSQYLPSLILAPTAV
jgi:hypothetical protein